MKKFMEKITSRKFLATLLTNIIAIATLLVDFDNEKVRITAIIVIAVANSLYGIVEGHIDAKAIAKTIVNTYDEAEKVKKEKK